MKKYIYILAPTVLLILCLGLINLGPYLLNKFSAQPAASPTASQTDAFADSGEFERLTTIEPSITPTLLPTSTPYIPPKFPAGTMIELLGPPPDSTFMISDTISLLWHWPRPLEEDQQLSAYLRFNGQEYLLGALGEPNIGNYYRVQFGAEKITGSTAAWQIRLESRFAPQSLLVESETRQLNILP